MKFVLMLYAPLRIHFIADVMYAREFWAMFSYGIQKPPNNSDGMAQSCGVMACFEICGQGDQVRLICGVKRALIKRGGTNVPKSL